MSVMIRRMWPPLNMYKIFNNQSGPTCLGDVDGKTYLADLFFFKQCEMAEAILKETIPLKEEEVDIEDAETESGEVTEWEFSGSDAG